VSKNEQQDLNKGIDGKLTELSVRFSCSILGFFFLLFFFDFDFYLGIFQIVI